MALIRRGEVWVACLKPNQGGEEGKVRPVVVIQADLLTDAGIPTVLVVPLTKRMRRGAELLRVLIPARERLVRDSYAMAEQPRALDRTRLGEGSLTRLTPDELLRLGQALRAVMDLG